MAQLVFVHGVNTRREPDIARYEATVADRKRRFQNVCFPKVDLEFHAPYWGVYGADPAWMWASVPKWWAPVVSLGFDDLQGQILIKAAAHDLAAIVGSLSILDLEAKAGDEKALQEAERLWTGAARYAEAVGAPGWLGEVKSDRELLERLHAEALAMAPKDEGIVSLGFGDSLQSAGRALLGGLNDLTSGPLVALVRKFATPAIATFTGDIFHYLADTAARDLIQKAVSTKLMDAARLARESNEPLILVGHSMGGIILYDMLSDRERVAELTAALGFEFKADLFLSVGSQVGLFEELKSFRKSDRSIRSPGKVARLKPVGLWWNVWDQMDPLAFLGAEIFDGVEDFQSDTIANVLSAHGAYFSSMMFYARVAKRLARAGLVR